jgi:hypothetical protein
VALSHRHATGHHHSVRQPGPAVPHNRAPADTGKRYRAGLGDKQVLPESFSNISILFEDDFCTNQLNSEPLRFYEAKRPDLRGSVSSYHHSDHAVQPCASFRFVSSIVARLLQA